jgi:DNA invertase Pin-like site-specific DNA recombinase
MADTEAQFRSLAERWADTGTSTGRLMLAVLGGLADVEGDLIRTRTAEGRTRIGVGVSIDGWPRHTYARAVEKLGPYRHRGKAESETGEARRRAGYTGRTVTCWNWPGLR